MKDFFCFFTSAARKSINKTNVIHICDDVLVFVETSYLYLT